MNRLINEKMKKILCVLSVVVTVSLCLYGCTNNKVKGYTPGYIASKTEQKVVDKNASDKKVQDKKTADAKAQDKKAAEKNIQNKNAGSKMVDQDVAIVGRSNPFMPYNEVVEYEKARRSAISEANAKNEQIKKLKKLQNYSVREDDDISPYSFNLPVPPTSLASGTVAAKITQTKVVGIMYNSESPTAIINVDNKDYLVRPGDKIIGQEYKVREITPTWVTAAMGSNVYSAAIGELFTKNGINTNQTDIYNLKERFGGRKI